MKDLIKEFENLKQQLITQVNEYNNLYDIYDLQNNRNLFKLKEMMIIKVLESSGEQNEY